jgi:hypothetical protein
MKSIWKFPMVTKDVQEIEMPKDAQLLTVQMQGSRSPCIWALVDPAAVKEKRTFRTYGTGHPITSGGLQYLGTYQLAGGSLIFHVFEQKG